MKKKKEKAKSQVARTTTGLIQAMFDEMDNLRDGTTTPLEAKAKVSVVNTILSTKRLELDVARFVMDGRAKKHSQELSVPAPIALDNK